MNKSVYRERIASFRSLRLVNISRELQPPTLPHLDMSLSVEFKMSEAGYRPGQAQPNVMAVRIGQKYKEAATYL